MGHGQAGCESELQTAVPCSGWCGFAVAGRWLGALAAERRVHSRHTQRDARMGPVARRVYAGVSGGSVRRRVRHAVVRLWAGGVAQERPRAAAAQEHAVRVPYGSCGAASSATSAGQPTVCVCAPHVELLPSDNCWKDFLGKTEGHTGKPKENYSIVWKKILPKKILPKKILPKKIPGKSSKMPPKNTPQLY